MTTGRINQVASLRERAFESLGSESRVWLRLPPGEARVPQPRRDPRFHRPRSEKSNLRILERFWAHDVPGCVIAAGHASLAIERTFCVGLRGRKPFVPTQFSQRDYGTAAEPPQDGPRRFGGAEHRDDAERRRVHSRSPPGLRLRPHRPPRDGNVHKTNSERLPPSSFQTPRAPHRRRKSLGVIRQRSP